MDSSSADLANHHHLRPQKTKRDFFLSSPRRSSGAPTAPFSNNRGVAARLSPPANTESKIASSNSSRRLPTRADCPPSTGPPEPPLFPSEFLIIGRAHEKRQHRNDGSTESLILGISNGKRKFQGICLSPQPLTNKAHWWTDTLGKMWMGVLQTIDVGKMPGISPAGISANSDVIGNVHGTT